jgi:hypothetical protein
VPPGCAATHLRRLRRISRRLQMTLVKLHACQYRKVKSFPDIGEKFEAERV